jgi:protein-tyrosine-phosphatase
VQGLPGSILFACTHNVIRSPMAEAIAKHLLGKWVFVDSAGLRKGEPDPFVVQVLDEIGIDRSKHRPKDFDDLEDSSFDLIVTLSPEAHHRALEFTRTMACDVQYWPTFDPSLVEGSREQRIEAYRDVRDDLMKRIRQRFPRPTGPTV